MTDLISKKTARPYVTSTDTAPAYWMIGIAWRLLASGVQTGGSICLADQLVPLGTGPNTHHHPSHEGLYVASGRCTFRAGGKVLDAGQGSFLNIPRHNEHSFTVEEGTRLINFYLPAGFDVWLMGAAVPAERNEPQPPGGAQPPHALIHKLGYDYVGGRPDPTDQTTRTNPVATPPSVTSADTVDVFDYDGAAWAVLADSETTGGAYCIFEVLSPQGRSETPHIHDATDEVICVLDGDVDVWLDGEVHRVTSEGLAFVPSGTVHACTTVSSTARILSIHTATGFDRVVRSLGAPLDTFALPESGAGAEPPLAERAAIIFGDVGLRELPALTVSGSEAAGA